VVHATQEEEEEEEVEVDRGLAIACRLSVRLSVTLVECDHIGWNSSIIISGLVSVGRSLSADPNIRGLR